MRKPLLILVSGASGSGKTTFCKELLNSIGSNYSGIIISQDDYYFASDMIPKLNTYQNYDHPEAFDWNKLKSNIDDLMNGNPTRIYKYDFSLSSPTNNFVQISNDNDFIILEGLYTLYDQELLKMASFKIFIETELDECIIRRILRDTKDRGRETSTIIERWRNVVRPMYKLYVEPTKINSDIIIPWYDNKENAIKIVKESIIERIKNEKY